MKCRLRSRTPPRRVGEEARKRKRLQWVVVAAGQQTEDEDGVEDDDEEVQSRTRVATEDSAGSRSSSDPPSPRGEKRKVEIGPWLQAAEQRSKTRKEDDTVVVIEYGKT